MPCGERFNWPQIRRWESTIQLSIFRSRADDINEERRVTIPWVFTPSTRKREILMPHSASAARPIRAESRARLVEGIAKARLWLNQLVSGAKLPSAKIAANARSA
jgi:hypothetical protein